MGDIEAGQKANLFVVAGITVLFSVIIHFLYKTIFGAKKKEALTEEAASDLGAAHEEASTETTATEGQTKGKSKKRGPWKGKSDFSHPWLFKNLKGHPGTVLLVDFSANGKFMAATCDGDERDILICGIYGNADYSTLEPQVKVARVK